MHHTDALDKLDLCPLAQARALQLPSREAMLQRSPLVQHFWDSNTTLLANAWHIWESNEAPNINLDATLLDPKLRDAVEQAWQDTRKETAVTDLWTEVCAGVYQAQIFAPERLIALRDYLTAVANAGIPIRPPYGIALNRHGAMLDPRSVGYLAAPAFQQFYQMFMDRYMRPIARMLFPEVMGYDSQTFAFSIQYQPGVDTSLQPHTDASATTLNININLPDEHFSGSEVDFFDKYTGQVNRVVFTSGNAMIHRGNVPHTAHPITGGSRSNLVLWLYGEGMQIPTDHAQQVTLTDKQRWSVPDTPQDESAPF